MWAEISSWDFKAKRKCMFLRNITNHFFFFNVIVCSSTYRNNYPFAQRTLREFNCNWYIFTSFIIGTKQRRHHPYRRSGWSGHHVKKYSAVNLKLFKYILCSLICSHKPWNMQNTLKWNFVSFGRNNHDVQREEGCSSYLLLTHFKKSNWKQNIVLIYSLGSLTYNKKPWEKRQKKIKPLRREGNVWASYWFNQSAHCPEEKVVRIYHGQYAWDQRGHRERQALLSSQNTVRQCIFNWLFPR